MRTFAIRPQAERADLKTIVRCEGDVVVEEVCAVCCDQGVIWHLHPESEPHKGSPHFRSYTRDARWWREMAEYCLKEAATLETLGTGSPE